MHVKIGIIKLSASSLFRPRRFASPRSAGFFRSGRQHAMPSAFWQLKKSTAVLHLGALSASITSLRPDDGLTNVIVGGNHLARARLLGIALSRAIETATADAVESYVRGADMIVVYEESSRWPVRVDTVWRAVAPAAPAQFLAAVDLIVSVRTHLLDMRPDLAVQSVIPSSDVFRLPNSRSAACDPLTPVDKQPVGKEPTVITPETGAGCLLFRFPGLDFSYIEMVHPADFEHDEVASGVGDPDVGMAVALPSLSLRGEAAVQLPPQHVLRIAHRLFRTTLEKGVILRARVRGVFVNRHDDARSAADCYAAFATADPPLGT
jgi:hypothetical protein